MHEVHYSIHDSNVVSVVNRLISRSNVGIVKYGTTTERGDLLPLEWLQHLQEELLDASVYIEALKKKVNMITAHVPPFDTVKPTALDLAYQEYEKKKSSPCTHQEPVNELVWNYDTKTFEKYTSPKERK